MTPATDDFDLISYEELFHILHGKFKVTHDEVRYWIKTSMDLVNEVESEFVFEVNSADPILLPYESDLPCNGKYNFPPDGFFYPEFYFYPRKFVNAFVPIQLLRFVYQKDLTAHRNWNDYRINDATSSVCQTLLRANEYGILRFYNSKLDEFTSHAHKSHLWCHTFEGESYVSEPNSFFLLYEILNLERIFFKKERRECLRELGLTSVELPNNVYKLNKKES